MRKQTLCALPPAMAVIEMADADPTRAGRKLFYPARIIRMASGYLQPAYFEATRRASGRTGALIVRYTRHDSAVAFLRKQAQEQAAYETSTSVGGLGQWG